MSYRDGGYSSPNSGAFRSGALRSRQSPGSDGGAADIDAIERKKSEHYAAQVELSKQEFVIFSRELAQLRECVAQLQESVGLTSDAHKHHASFEQRIDYLEKIFGDSADKHGKLIADMKNAHDKHRKDLEEHKKLHASLPERVAYIEKDIGDSADKHAKMVADLKRSHDGLLAHHQQHHATLPERVSYLEKQFGDSADKHAKMLQDLHSKHEKLADNHSKHAGIEERVAYLEKEIGDSADRHAKLLTEMKSHGDLKGSHAKHVKDTEARHGSVEQRLAYLEKEMGDSFDKHARELDNVKKAHDKHAKSLDDVKMSKGHHASLEERMAILEKAVKDSADKHAQTSSIKEELATMYDQLEALTKSMQRDAESKMELVRDIRAASPGRRQTGSPVMRRFEF